MARTPDRAPAPAPDQASTPLVFDHCPIDPAKPDASLDIVVPQRDADTGGFTRRRFTHQTMGALLGYALLETVITGDALADAIKPVTAAWLKDLNDYSLDLRNKKITQVQWQEKAEALYKKADLKDLLKFIDFDKLSDIKQWRDKGERSLKKAFPKVEGFPDKLAFRHQFFALRKDRSVVPHGHNNMATAFIILKGDFDGKHYDRLEDQPKHMIIKPTIDRKFKPGEYSTISDFKDNVHWFKALTDKAFIFNMHVLNIDPKVKKGGRVYIDPDGEKLKGGTILAPRISGSAAFKKYG